MGKEYTKDVYVSVVRIKSFNTVAYDVAIQSENAATADVVTYCSALQFI